MPHVALLGDSIFDNRAYTCGEPDVADQLRALRADWKVTLLALDGSTTTSVGPQISRCPKDASHLVLSLGGNDALGNAHLLDTPVRSSGAALDLFTEALAEFEFNYGNVLDALADRGQPLTVCTIYNGNLPAPGAARARTALMMFNDVIVRAAAARAADVIELRTVCTEPSDYANPIEPSGRGGAKIATAIASAVAEPRSRASSIHVVAREGG